MLLKEFDPNPNAVINPRFTKEDFPNFPKITISVFSDVLFEEVLELLDHEVITETRSCNGVNPIYRVRYKDVEFAYYHSFVGGPMTVANYEEVHAMGSETLIILGNCGVLDKDIQDCGIIIPTLALRDEGTSFHYVPSSESIEVNKKYIPEFKEVLQEAGYPYVEGTTWTTDAFYRETRDKVNRRKEMGAICVEMECACLQAMCDFRNTEFFQFFYAGDNLDHSSWDPRSLTAFEKLDDKLKIVFLAFELGLKVAENKGILVKK